MSEILGFLLVSVLLPTILAEIQGKCPSWSRSLVLRASKLMPSRDQDRYREEWLAEVGFQEQNGGKATILAWALFVFSGAVVIAHRGVASSAGRRSRLSGYVEHAVPLPEPDLCQVEEITPQEIAFDLNGGNADFEIKVAEIGVREANQVDSRSEDSAHRRFKADL